MELKSLAGLPDEVGVLGSNRTFMELKLNDPEPFARSPPCSNRTFMELKSVNDCAAGSGRLVLIVPLWN